MTQDIFSFWSKIPDHAFVHPEDKLVFARVPHSLRRDCLPTCFVGPLFDARVVLLFLSPGYDEFDTTHALTADGRAYYCKQRSGKANLPSAEEHAPANKWTSRVLKQFGFALSDVADGVAILNMGAYHSKSFRDWPMLTALPSSRVALDWGQNKLFPKAESGEEWCLRSSRMWGLSKGECYGQGLFAPICTPNGIMHPVPMRERVITSVRSALDLSESHPIGSISMH